MSPRVDAPLLDFVARELGATSARRGETLHSLWGGCGELFRVHLAGALESTAVVKRANLTRHDGSPVSHARKRASYDVELAFYRSFARECGETFRVPRLLAANKPATSEWWLVLEDLSAGGFERHVRSPKGPTLATCIEWLARFHAHFFGRAPEGLWPEGTYWHLGTRREECARIPDRALANQAPELDRLLREARFQTLVHGDAKPMNFCFSPDERRVAAVDFQYCGRGSGVRDVAYLLHGSVSGAEEASALALYFRTLTAAMPSTLARDVEEEGRALYPVAQRDFERFLAGWGTV